MKPHLALFGLLISLLLLGPFACKQSDTQPAVCRLTSTSDQLVETSGKLTDELIRTFGYTNGTLTTASERSATSDATFSITYANSQITQAVSGSMVISFSYPAGSTVPASATFSRGGVVQSTFTLAYTTPAQLSTVTENRSVLVPNSLVTARSYSFTYDSGGNLTNERARFTLTGGVISEQETEYAFDTKPSPYTHLAERPLLTILALSQAVETKPGRFWQINAYKSYKLYILTSTGSRANVRDESTVTPNYDTDNKLMSQEQNALLYQGGNPTPITKRNRQTFGYQCE